MFCPMCGSKLSTQEANTFGYTMSVRCSASVCTGCQIEYEVILDDQVAEYLSMTGQPLQMPGEEDAIAEDLPDLPVFNLAHLREVCP